MRANGAMLADNIEQQGPRQSEIVHDKGPSSTKPRKAHHPTAGVTVGHRERGRSLGIHNAHIATPHLSSFEPYGIEHFERSKHIRLSSACPSVLLPHSPHRNIHPSKCRVPTCSNKLEATAESRMPLLGRGLGIVSSIFTQPCADRDRDLETFSSWLRSERTGRWCMLSLGQGRSSTAPWPRAGAALSSGHCHPPEATSCHNRLCSQAR